MTKAYIGDGVYVDMVGGDVVLTTQNGYSITNTIFLEPEVYDLLVEYVEERRKHAREQVKPSDA